MICSLCDLLGPNDISIRDASCIVSGLGSQGLPKGSSTCGFLFRTQDSTYTNAVFEGRQMYAPIMAMVGARDHAYHMQRRRPWARAFNVNSLKEYEPHIEKRAQQLVDELAKRQGEVVDLTEWVSFFT